MPNISIGTVTLSHNPTKMTLIRGKKSCAAVETYTSVAYFSWGTSIVGARIDLEFSYMDSAEFDDIDDLYKGDLPQVFNPQDYTGKTFNVEILDLDGVYHHTLDVTAGHMRKQVILSLLILSEVTA